MDDKRSLSPLIIWPLTMAAALFCLLFFDSVVFDKSISKPFLKTSSKNRDLTCVDCPSTLTPGCLSTSESVMGGLDFVQYFTDFKLTDQTYNESLKGEQGLSTIYSTYKGYTFNFLSNEHKELFDVAPANYIPQFGGFCAWGMAEEICPTYPWSPTCLGPSGDWGEWTIYNSKLYFFLKATPKEYFLSGDTQSFVDDGNSRWTTWFPDGNAFNTECSTS